MQSFIHPDMRDVTLDAVLYALADPARRAIVRALAADRACEGNGLSCNAAAPPDLPKATMSLHYAKLRAAGVVRATRKGVSVIHTLRCDEINAKFPGLLPAILESVEV
ncbi:MAG: helix-turn-helix transcriptional regulator [Aquidulcibacter sp.]|nr:helix-turn-helix transcriptional regulator [Aquidulcibacter sp.]